MEVDFLLERRVVAKDDPPGYVAFESKKSTSREENDVSSSSSPARKGKKFAVGFFKLIWKWSFQLTDSNPSVPMTVQVSNKSLSCRPTKV